MLRKFWLKTDPKADTMPLSTVATQTEAAKAKTNAEASLREVKAQKPLVDELVSKLHAQKDRNHFGELLEATMRGVG